MQFLSREQIMNELQQSFQSYIGKFGLDDIGIFEEQGEGDHYYFGYTVKKDGETYHIHSPYIKNNSGGLAPIKNEWTLEPDEPKEKDNRGYTDIESVFRDI